MFVVDDILISEEVAEASFACCLSACRGACCVEGEAGAPLEPDERASLERALPAVRDDLRPEARAVIDKRGAWEETAPGRYNTTCVGEAECVFVTYDGPAARCALQQAYAQGRTDFPKPISCHLYPLRVEQRGGREVLRYERIGLCAGGRTRGRREGAALADFLRAPLVRKYGAAWYERFRAACASPQHLE